MANHTSFAAVSAVVELLKIKSRERWMLTDLLSKDFSRKQAEQAIDTALSVKLIRVSGLIEPVALYDTIYSVSKG